MTKKQKSFELDDDDSDDADFGSAEPEMPKRNK